MDKILEKKIDDAIWIARSLFDRGKATGSVANLSFRYGNKIYITGSGTCFGKLSPNDFAVVGLDGQQYDKLKPSKELPLHLSVFKAQPKTGAVIHVHSRYSVLWSCVPDLNETDCMPDHTPYLKMQLGTVGLIPYEPPGSKELFDVFDKRVEESDGWLLSHHGPVVPGNDLMHAFYALEEMEESAYIAWELRSKL